MILYQQFKLEFIQAHYNSIIRYFSLTADKSVQLYFITIIKRQFV